MKSERDLQDMIRRLDGKGYKAYKDLQGGYDFGAFELIVDHVQGDPFASPSKIIVRLENDFPKKAYLNKSREVAFRDFLTRQFSQCIRRHAKGDRGSGKSGTIFIDHPGQEILERSSVTLSGKQLELRFRVGLPAFGRRIAGRQAEAIFLQEIPNIVQDSLYANVTDESKLRRHVLTNEDADALRDQLQSLGIIGFVADGSILPRISGVDPRPLKNGIPFKSPDSLRMEITLPNRTVKGMGIPKGITLIVGGGFHGKSTLLKALELGVYNHIPGDGREFVVADPTAVKIRAEDGRFIEKVNISPFINDLPHGKDTLGFSTPNASGSTSQAANVIEALEAGTKTLLIDEDTSATNFMIRDHRMQQLVPKDREPITPFIDKARQLFEEHGVSSLIVVGGSGLYFDIADRVLCMIEYLPHDLTDKAKEIVQAYAGEREAEGGGDFGELTARIPLANSLDAQKGHREKIRPFGKEKIQFGNYDIDLTAVEQLIDPSQLHAIAAALLLARRLMENRTMVEVLDLVMEKITQESLDVLSRNKEGNYAAFRRMELAAVINRLRSLKIL